MNHATEHTTIQTLLFCEEFHENILSISSRKIIPIHRFRPSSNRPIVGIGQEGGCIYQCVGTSGGRWLAAGRLRLIFQEFP